MSSLTLPNWPAARTLTDDGFRSWLKGVASPNGTGSGNGERRLPRSLAPIAVQAALGRGANKMVADALAAGPEHLPQQMAVVSERIGECLDASAAAGQDLLRHLKGSFFTPVDVEDVFQLSRVVMGGTARLGAIASAYAAMHSGEQAFQPVHTAVERSFEIVAESLGQLGDRDRTYAAVVGLIAQRDAARQFCREHFTRRMPEVKSAADVFTLNAIRQTYGDLVRYLGCFSSTLYRTALKNG